MDSIHWIITDGYQILEAIGIILSLCFSGYALLREHKSRMISNLLALTTQHREIWSQIYTRPSLTRILDDNVRLGEAPVTDEEAIFLNFLIQHLSATYRAMREGMFETQQSIQGDIRWFFELPIPRSVWYASRALLEPDFVEFVERGFRDKPSGSSNIDGR